MDDRLPAALEVAAIMRRAETGGGFATVMKKGDADRGSLLLVIASRGRHVACLERVLGATGEYNWQTSGPADSTSSTELVEFLARRARFDEDLWSIELDIADAERFIAETIASG